MYTKSIDCSGVKMDSTTVTVNDSSSSDDSSDSSLMMVDGSENEDRELDKYYDPETFEWFALLSGNHAVPVAALYYCSPFQLIQ